jgi:hypothetical protein
LADEPSAVLRAADFACRGKRAKLMTMDDDDYAKLADETAARLRHATDRTAELKAIIAESDVVFGLYFDPESLSRWDKYLIKGEANSHSTRIACIWCKAIDEALALQRLAASL